MQLSRQAAGDRTTEMDKAVRLREELGSSCFWGTVVFATPSELRCQLPRLSQSFS